MEQNKRTRIAVLIALIVLLAVFGSFAYSVFSARTTGVSLPSPQPDVSTGSPDAPNAQLVEVTADTVQAVIASLDRVESYYRPLTIQTNWGTSSSTISVRTWVDGGYTYSRIALPSGVVRYSLSDATALYYWYAGSSSYLTAPPNTLNADLAQHIPTYEDVLNLPTERIQDAGYGTYGDQLCIYVETAPDELGYVEHYWVSVETGLLTAAETLDGEDVVLSVNATFPITSPCPANVKFALPNGKVLHSI